MDVDTTEGILASHSFMPVYQKDVASTSCNSVPSARYFVTLEFLNSIPR